MRLKPYHAGELYNKLAAAVKSKALDDITAFEPKEVWAKIKDEENNMNELTKEEILQKEKLLATYLEKFVDAHEDDEHVEKEIGSDDAESDGSNEINDQVPLTEHSKEWDSSEATDIDRRLVDLYRLQRYSNGHAAKSIRNLLIMSLCTQHRMPKKVIAEKVGLSCTQVRTILRDLAKVDVPVIVSRLEELLHATRSDFDIKNAVDAMVSGGRGLLTEPLIRRNLNEAPSRTLTRFKVRRAITVDCGLVYKKVVSLAPYVNSRKNIVLRRLMACHLIDDVLKKDNVIVNFDECTFSETTSRTHSWSPRGRAMCRTWKKSIPNVNLFLATFDDGTNIAQFSTGTNNQVTFCSWLLDFARYMDQHRPDHRKHHWLIMDNMAGHKTALAKIVLAHLGLRISFSAPASFSSMPVERLFGIVKSKFLDGENVGNQREDPHLSHEVAATMTGRNKQEKIVVRIGRLIKDIGRSTKRNAWRTSTEALIAMAKSRPVI